MIFRWWSIPDQTIAEGQSFSQINLDDFVADADDPDSVVDLDGYRTDKSYGRHKRPGGYHND